MFKCIGLMRNHKSTQNIISNITSKGFGFVSNKHSEIFKTNDQKFYYYNYQKSFFTKKASSKNKKQEENMSNNNSNKNKKISKGKKSLKGSLQPSKDSNSDELEFSSPSQSSLKEGQNALNMEKEYINNKKNIINKDKKEESIDKIVNENNNDLQSKQSSIKCMIIHPVFSER